MASEDPVKAAARMARVRLDIDELDARIAALLALRFEKTHQVGLLKAQAGAAAIEPERQVQRAALLQALARRHGLSEAMLKAVYKAISTEVVARHIDLGAGPVA